MNYDTKSRRMLLALFQETGDAALSTEEITEKMKDSGVGVSTLYRRLAALCREGLLTRFRAADGEYVYRSTGRADAECNCLFHLKCTVCACVSHLDCRHGQELIEHIGAEHGFRIDRCKTVLYGECARGAAKEGQKNK